MKKWYEITVAKWDYMRTSYDKLGHKTKTIATFDTLREAKNYAKNCDALKEGSIEFLFIDKWTFDTTIIRKKLW